MSSKTIGKLRSNYSLYLRKLGYGNHTGEFNGFFIKRAFFLCWAKPGFHLFWRYWNSGISFFTFQLYEFLGGNKRRYLNMFIVFEVNALVHNIVVLPFLGWSFTLPITFLFFALFAIISEKVEFILKQRTWHSSLNVMFNLIFVITSFEFGFQLNDMLFELI